jgi:hypothetical protein
MQVIWDGRVAFCTRTCWNKACLSTIKVVACLSLAAGALEDRAGRRFAALCGVWTEERETAKRVAG